MKKHLLAGVSAIALIAAASSAFAHSYGDPAEANSTVNASFGNASTESATASGNGNSTVSASFGGNSTSSTDAEGYEASGKATDKSGASSGSSYGSTNSNKFGPGGTNGGTSASDYSDDSESGEVGGFGYNSQTTVTQPKTTSTILSGSVTNNTVDFRASAAAVSGTAKAGTSTETSYSNESLTVDGQYNSADSDKSSSAKSSDSLSASAGVKASESTGKTSGTSTNNSYNNTVSTTGTNATGDSSTSANAVTGGYGNGTQSSGSASGNGSSGSSATNTTTSNNNSSTTGNSGKSSLEASGYLNEKEKTSDSKTSVSSSDSLSIGGEYKASEGGSSSKSETWGNSGTGNVNASASSAITELDGNTFEDANSNGILSVNQNTGENALTQESVTVSTGDIAVDGGSVKSASSAPLTSSILSGAVSNNHVEFDAASAATNSGYNSDKNTNAASAAGVGLVEGNTFSGLTSNGIASVNQNTGSNALTQQGVTVSTGNIAVSGGSISLAALR